MSYSSLGESVGLGDEGGMERSDIPGLGRNSEGRVPLLLLDLEKVQG